MHRLRCRGAACERTAGVVEHLSAFNPKAPPAKAPAFWEIVDAGVVPEDAELADALDNLGRPDASGNLIRPAAVTLERVMRAGSPEFDAQEGKNWKTLPHRFERVGYAPIRNSDAADGLWRINGRRQVVYARNGLSTQEKIKGRPGLNRRTATYTNEDREVGAVSMSVVFCPQPQDPHDHQNILNLKKNPRPRRAHARIHARGWR